ncbi:hypothetical protein NL676_012576 [Syzygium grande]|nr:hypothetical protein NL676_012576 [Syzygium grande]
MSHLQAASHHEQLSSFPDIDVASLHAATTTAPSPVEMTLLPLATATLTYQAAHCRETNLTCCTLLRPILCGPFTMPLLSNPATLPAALLNRHRHCAARLSAVVQ